MMLVLFCCMFLTVQGVSGSNRLDDDKKRMKGGPYTNYSHLKKSATGLYLFRLAFVRVFVRVTGEENGGDKLLGG